MKRAALLVVMMLGGSSAAMAGSFSVGIGPEIIDNGGSYPQFLPPVDPGQYTFTIVTDSGFEINIAEVPGLLFGYRFKSRGLYVGVGGGELFDARGFGFGVYSSFGYESGDGDKGCHFFASYTQTLGVTKGDYMAPSALRLGAIWEY